MELDAPLDVLDAPLDVLDAPLDVLDAPLDVLDASDASLVAEPLDRGHADDVVATQPSGEPLDVSEPPPSPCVYMPPAYRYN